MKLVDLSVSIVSGMPVEPPTLIPQIEYKNHKQSIPEMLSMFPGVDESALPDGCGWAVETIHCGTHCGTHLDAPYHYHPTMNRGQPAWTIDQIPLDWCLGNGVVLDLSDKADGYICTPKDLRQALDRIGYTLQPGNVVFIYTGAQKHWGTSRYLSAGCGIGRDATLWLCDQGIRLMGTDAWSWDAPLASIAENYAKTKDASVIWEGHKAGADRAYCHIEKLTNLDKLPSTGFFFVGFPVKIERASAGWIRAVAIISEEKDNCLFTAASDVFSS